MKHAILVAHESAAFHESARRLLLDFVLHVVGTAREASTAISARRWAGIVSSTSLPDASGLVLAHFARDRDPDVPILLCSSSKDVSLANRAQLVNAHIAYEPFIDGNVIAFATLVRRRFSDRAERMHDIVDTLGTSWKLSPQERHVVELAAYGVSRDGICAELHVTRNTLKTVVGRILRKADCADLDEVVRAALDRAAFG
jgi:DNA-binding NarL/FixJ family response regulator